MSYLNEQAGDSPNPQGLIRLRDGRLIRCPNPFAIGDPSTCDFDCVCQEEAANLPDVDLMKVDTVTDFPTPTPSPEPAS